MSGDSRSSDLMSISEASRVLGVSETTLRQWTDDGRVRAFVTPGGHRRYSRSDLKTLLHSPGRTHGVRDLVTQVEGASAKQREIIQQYLSYTDWYRTLDEHHKEAIRERGRRLVELVILYITKPAAQEETLQAARGLGDEFGAELAKLRLSLTDTLEAFVLHRIPVLDAATELIKTGQPVSKRTLAAIHEISYLIDQTLLSLVKGHQRVSAPWKVAEGT